jgi:D-serine deaminase-like pyridoxal phosphate-dependent protein
VKMFRADQAVAGEKGAVHPTLYRWLADLIHELGTGAALGNDSVTDAILRNSAALSVVGRSANSAGDPADIEATAASGHVLREAGGVLGFGQIVAAAIAAGAVTDAKLRDSAALSILGRAANSIGTPTDIVAGADEQILTRRAGTLVFAAGSGFAACRTSAAQTFANGAWSMCTFNSEDDDDDNAFDPATGVFTAPRAGRYIFAATITVGGIDNGERAVLGYFKNGALLPARQGGTSFSSTGGQDISTHLTLPLKLAAGDTIQVGINHNEGADATQTVEASGAFNWFHGMQVR